MNLSFRLQTEVLIANIQLSQAEIAGIAFGIIAIIAGYFIAWRLQKRNQKENFEFRDPTEKDYK